MMHQQSATPHYSSAQTGGQHYQGQPAMAMMGQGAQGTVMMSQRPIGTYRSSQQGRCSTSSSRVDLEVMSVTWESSMLRLSAEAQNLNCASQTVVLAMPLSFSNFYNY